MSTIRNMTEKQPPSYPLRMPQELRERLAEVAKANGRSINAEILARLQSSFDLAPPDRIAVDTTQGMKVYAPEGELPSADEIADKVAERQQSLLAELLNQQRISTMESLRAQLTTHQEEIRQLHNPLSRALEEIDLARREKDDARVSAAQKQAAALQARLAQLDELCDDRQKLISELRDQLLPGSGVHPFHDAIVARQERIKTESHD